LRIAVTTSLHPSPAEAEAARAAARRWGLPLAERRNRSLGDLRAAEAVDGLLLLTARSAKLWLPPPSPGLPPDAELSLSPATAQPPHPALSPEGSGERVMAWSPGMGALRAKRVAKQLALGRPRVPAERDPFFEAADLRPGDAVLDCTLGLGADALVAAVAVGAAGRVVGIEGSVPLAAWVAEGLARHGDPAAARIEIRAGDHGAILASLPDRCFDVVCFDPMFRHARAEPGGFDVVRFLADARPLTREAVAQARRVARRWVLVKDGAPGWDLARLGLTPMPSARGAHRYFARLPAG
jgi:16S rRNA (guanine1516-N2)-methyltransferase